MKFTEKYKRPCFAECAKCGQHGVIVFLDGSHSEQFVTIKDGEKLVRKLVADGKLTQDDAERISDHLVASDLLHDDREVIQLIGMVEAAVLIQRIKDEEKHRWN